MPTRMLWKLFGMSIPEWPVKVTGVQRRGGFSRRLERLGKPVVFCATSTRVRNALLTAAEFGKTEVSSSSRTTTLELALTRS